MYVYILCFTLGVVGEGVGYFAGEHAYPSRGSHNNLETEGGTCLKTFLVVVPPPVVAFGFDASTFVARFILGS